MTAERFIKRCKRAEWYAQDDERSVQTFASFAMWLVLGIFGLLIIEDHHHLHPLGWVIFGCIYEVALFIFSWGLILRNLMAWRHYRWRERLRNRPDMRDQYRSEILEAQLRTEEAHRRALQEQVQILHDREQHRKAVTF